MTSFKKNLQETPKQSRRQHLLEGDDKIIFQGSEPGTIVLYFKDSNQDYAHGKAAINNKFSEVMMTRLGEMGIETHFVRTLNMYEQLVRACSPFSFSVHMHHVAVDDFAKKFELEELTFLPEVITEFQTISKDQVCVLSPKHITSFGLADLDELDQIETISGRVFDIMAGQCLAVGLRLLNLKLKFGRYYVSDYEEETRVMLIDEISPDSMAVLDLKTHQRYDPSSCKNLSDGGFNAYQNLAKRFNLINLV
jgi:phosphoribosylaminoimidazole-succinocarboxamide synthase